ncbi:MAG TPA: hypothetical protein VK550_11840 [Polyangiaceae bacterium]|nr:hypothetical protein [Polyangiaceae bacterium]
MDLQERSLYHQVHPLKLAVDIGTAAISLCLLWQRHLYVALAVMWLPSIFVTALLIRSGSFEKVRDSRVGELLRRRMTHSVEALRFGGLGIAAFGAWFRSAAAIVAGVLLIGACWAWCLTTGSANSRPAQ